MQFATTEQEFVQALEIKHKRQKKGLGNNDPKGLKAIVDDNPKVGALIQFDFDSAVIKPVSYSLLREFANALKVTALSNAKINILGHTDSRGTVAYNLDLSKRRAQAVKDFLVFSYGIKANRLTITAFGESKPLYPNDTEHEKNRRVEFVRVE